MNFIAISENDEFLLINNVKNKNEARKKLNNCIKKYEKIREHAENIDDVEDITPIQNDKLSKIFEKINLSIMLNYFDFELIDQDKLVTLEQIEKSNQLLKKELNDIMTTQQLDIKIKQMEKQQVQDEIKILEKTLKILKNKSR